MTRSLAVELGPHQININAIAPGFTDSEGARAVGDVTKYDVTRTPMGRLEQPHDLFGALVFLASDDSDFVTGQVLLVDGGGGLCINSTSLLCNRRDRDEWILS
jgi:NAD(P)-dependent dehydrogenase (short-subunit alcohol dehydrogenase family)